VYMLYNWSIVQKNKEGNGWSMVKLWVLLRAFSACFSLSAPFFLAF